MRTKLARNGKLLKQENNELSIQPKQEKECVDIHNLLYSKNINKVRNFMKLQEQKEKLQSLVDQYNQANEQITMLQASNADLRLQISKQQGIIEALESVKKGKQNAKT